MANTATSKGAAIYGSSSTFILQGSSSFMNNSANYGGGESSILTLVHGKFSYLNNTALRGGAQYFDVNSNFSKQHMYTSKVMRRLSLVVQYMLKMYLPEVNTSFIFRMTNC